MNSNTPRPVQTGPAGPDEVVLGLDTFGDTTVDENGTPLHHAQVLRNVVEEAVAADSFGVDAITIGEHHRPDFAVSSPEIVLSAIAARTKRILMGTGVTVLSTDDPVRVYQRFATLDAISNGRSEIVLGRGSFTESYPLFGYNLANYEGLFTEKLDLFAKLRSEEPVTWSGQHYHSLHDQQVYPTTEQPDGVRAWIGVGGSPESVLRSVRTGIPMMLAIIGGDPSRFLPFVHLYRERQASAGSPYLPLGVHSPGHIAETDEQAVEELWPYFRENRNKIGAERGWPPARLPEFQAEVQYGALHVGSPETVAQKIANTVRVLGADRFDLKYSNGPMPHGMLMKSIELYGTQVIPRVRELLAENPPAEAPLREAVI